MNLNRPGAAQTEDTGDFSGSFWTEDEYQQQVAEMVADETPAMFAVVEDWDDRYDGRIAAWVLEFPEGTEVICTDGNIRMISLKDTLAHF